MATPLIQSQLNAGELSPSLYGRVDLAKYREGCSTLRNMWASYKGGASSRAGTKWVGQARQNADDYPPQLIPFQFSVDQGYLLVFSDREMSVVANGAYVLRDPFTVSAATNANPGAITAAGNDFTSTDWVYFSGMEGLTDLNGRMFAVNTTGSTFTVKSTLTGTSVSTTASGVYTTGGTVAKLFVLPTPYVSADLQALKWAQSADVMSITHPSYPPMDITRVSVSNWTITTTSFTASIAPPASTAASASTTTSSQATQYQYVVTSVDQQTGEESVRSPIATVNNSVNIAQTLGTERITWTSVTGAQYYNVYKATPAVNGAVPIGAMFGFAGSSFGLSFVDTNVTQDFTVTPPKHLNPFAPGAIDYFVITNTGSGYSEFSPPTVYVSDPTGTGAIGEAVVVGTGVQAIIVLDGGHDYSSPSVAIAYGGTGTGFAATAVPNGHGLWDGGSSPSNVTITNTGSGYASSVIVLAQYPLNGNPVTLVASAVTTSSGHITAVTFPATVNGQKPVATDVVIQAADSLGTGAAATAHVGPTTGTYPSVVSYFQQRRFYANTVNNPDTYYGSQPGAFTNMDRSIPTVASDAIVGTPWAQQVNGIQSMVPMPGGLVILTGLGAWQLNGGSGGAAVTPIDQSASPQAYNGTAPLIKPITINYDILYVQEKGSIVRDLNYNFFANIYTGADLTVLSNHLFTGRTIERWDWAEEPYKLVWAVRDDGILLSMTYLKMPSVAGSQAPDNDIYSWARHDTQGLFQSVACVTEPPVDAPYFVVKRTIAGTTTSSVVPIVVLVLGYLGSYLGTYLGTYI